jgi:hypothetical protein
VIQQLGVSEDAAYRVVAYGDDQPPRHSDFGNADLLRAALRAAIPDFDFSQLTLNPLKKGQGSIAFVGEMNLNQTQLSLLGLA